jgi:hypothetical protein
MRYLVIAIALTLTTPAFAFKRDNTWVDKTPIMRQCLADAAKQGAVTQDDYDECVAEVVDEKFGG